MKAWVKTLGTVAALGTAAPLALGAAWYALDGTVGPTEDAGTQQYGLAGQNVAGNDGLDLVRAISSTKATRAFGQLIVPAASGELTLAAFENSPLLEPTKIIVVGSAALSAPVLLGGAQEEAAGDSGFTTFRREAGNTSRRSTAARSRGRSLGSLTSGAGMISGPSGGGSALRPDTLHLLQASGGLGESGAGPGTGGLPGYDLDATIQVTPLPPAILAFLSGLAALFAFRRVRAKSAEPAIG